MKQKLTVEKTRNTKPNKLLAGILWGMATLMTAVLIFVLVQFFTPKQPAWQASLESLPQESNPAGNSAAALPAFEGKDLQISLPRFANPRTIIPTRARKDVIEYTIELGDSVFGISQQFNVSPETILWANKEYLKR